MQFAIVKKAKAKDGTVTLEFYNEADSKMVKTGETKTVKVDENSYIMFGNIFIYKGLGKFTNKRSIMISSLRTRLRNTRASLCISSCRLREIRLFTPSYTLSIT